MLASVIAFKKTTSFKFKTFSLNSIFQTRQHKYKASSEKKKKLDILKLDK